MLSRMMDAPKLRRRWLRYGLILLLALAIVAIVVNLVTQKMHAVMQRTDALEAVVEAGGEVRFDFQIDESGNRLAKARLPGPSWLRWLTGDDLGAHVVEAQVETDEALKRIAELPQLWALHLSSKGITDAGLARLHCMSQLQVLSLEETQVTERGVTNLRKALPNCQIVR
jgi:hypothetical protein